MPERTVTIAAAEGLHARPAAEFARAAKDLGVPVRITYGEKTVNAASILGVLSLGAGQGAEVQLATDDGSDAQIDGLAHLLATHE